MQSPAMPATLAKIASYWNIAAAEEQLGGSSFQRTNALAFGLTGVVVLHHAEGTFSKNFSSVQAL